MLASQPRYFSLNLWNDEPVIVLTMKVDSWLYLHTKSRILERSKGIPRGVGVVVWFLASMTS